MAYVPLMADQPAFPSSPSDPKAYNRRKLASGFFSAFVSLCYLVLLVDTGASVALERFVRTVAQHDYLALLTFAGAIGILHGVVTLPISYYRGFHLEHRYHLSNQSLRLWASEKAKATLVGLPLAAGLVVVLYASIQQYAIQWWIPVGTAVTLLSILLARLAPILIMPLFYKFTPIDSAALKDRISKLCAAAELRVEGVFTFNLSKNTKKANAGFTGIGKSKRIILGDTLLREFTEDEIETVFAHELGHYRHRHLLIGILTGTVSTFAGLYCAALLYEWSTEYYGLAIASDIAALPLLLFWISVIGIVTTPLTNALSRRHERQADRFAVAITGKPGAFASALNKLSALNLADPDPHPLVEFLFYSHPAIARRVRMVEAMGV